VELAAEYDSLLGNRLRGETEVYSHSTTSPEPLWDTLAADHLNKL
jgi:hypothetical protein